MDRDNLLLGMIGVELGLITPEQLEQCTQIQESQLNPQPLGELFCENSFLTARQLDRLLQEQKKRQEDFADVGLFGQIAIERGYVSVQQLGECVREQIRSSAKIKPLLGEVMIRKEYLSLSQLREILGEQGKQLVYCSKCDRYELFPSQFSVEEQSCSGCQGPLLAAETRAGSSNHEGAHSGNTTVHFKLPLTSLDKFQILGEIARGSMGIVFKAFDSTLDRIVALKVLKEGDADANYLQRLQREGAIAAKLHHPNVVTIHEVGKAGGLHYLCMDYIEGVDFLDYIHRKKLGRKECLRLVETISRAVHYAHVHGVIHRDLKPSNILVDERGTPIITDFGLAKSADTRLDMTKEGTALGTPYYMPPEQVLGKVKKIDPRSDVYAIGVILYEILAERHPFSAKTTVDLYQKILHEDPKPLRAVNDTIDPDLEAIVMKSIEKDPEFRYFSAEDLAMDLRRYLAGDPILAKRSTHARRVVRKWKKYRGRLLTGVAVALIAVGVTFLVLGWKERTHIRGRMEEAKQLQENRSWVLAIQEYRKIETLDPDQPEVKAKILSCLQQMTIEADQIRKEKKWEESARRYQTILSLQKDYPPAIRGLERSRIAFELAQERVKFEAESRGRIHAEEERVKRMAAARPHYESGFRKFHDASIYMHLPGFEVEELQQRYINAVDDFTRAIERSPDFAEAHFFRAKCNLHLQKFAAAREGLSRVLELAPSHSAAWYERGKIQILHGFRARYPILLTLILQKTLLSEAPLEEALEEFWKEARSDLDNAMAYSTISSPRLDERFLTRGYIDLTEGRFHDAVINFTRVMGVNSVNADACFGRAYAHFFLGELSLSLAYVDRAILLQPDSSFSHVLRSLIFFAQEEYSPAIEELQGEFDRVATTGVLEMMASLYQAIGKYEDSLSCVDRLLVYLPEDLLLRERRAQLLLHMGEIEDCLNECLAMLGRDQNCVGAHRVAALAYSLDGEIEKAIEHYEETLRLDPTDDEALSNYASILLEQENPDRAYELAEQALSFNRKNAHAWLVLAVILSDRGRVAEAVVRFERSLELNPKQARGYLQYGRTLVRLERYEEAIRAFRKAKELDPELGDVLDRLIREAKGE